MRTYIDASRRVEHDAAKIMSLTFLVPKSFVKTRFLKNTIFTFLDLCSLTRWSKVKSDGMLVKELQMSYRFLCAAASYLY